MFTSILTTAKYTWETTKYITTHKWTRVAVFTISIFSAGYYYGRKANLRQRRDGNDIQRMGTAGRGDSQSTIPNSGRSILGRVQSALLPVSSSATQQAAGNSILSRLKCYELGCGQPALGADSVGRTDNNSGNAGQLANRTETNWAHNLGVLGGFPKTFGADIQVYRCLDQRLGFQGGLVNYEGNSIRPLLSIAWSLRGLTKNWTTNTSIYLGATKISITDGLTFGLRVNL